MDVMFRTKQATLQERLSHSLKFDQHKDSIDKLGYSVP